MRNRIFKHPLEQVADLGGRGRGPFVAFAEDDVLNVGGGDVLNGFFSQPRIDFIVQISADMPRILTVLFDDFGDVALGEIEDGGRVGQRVSLFLLVSRRRLSIGHHLGVLFAPSPRGDQANCRIAAEGDFFGLPKEAITIAPGDGA